MDGWNGIGRIKVRRDGQLVVLEIHESTSEAGGRATRRFDLAFPPDQARAIAHGLLQSADLAESERPQ